MLNFNELNKEAQEKAVQDYINGWEETRPNDELDYKEVREILSKDLVEDKYDDKGKLISFLSI